MTIYEHLRDVFLKLGNAASAKLNWEKSLKLDATQEAIKLNCLNLPLMANKQLTIEELELKAKEIRRLIIQMLVKAGSGHPGGSLSATDLITALYYNVLNFKSNDPQWPDRDRFHMSKGHCCPLWYAVLAKAGYFRKKNYLP